MRPLPFFSKRQDQRRLQDFLMAHADALIAGTLDRAMLARQFDGVDLTQIDALLTLAERVSETLSPVAPSEEFVARLRHALLTSGLFEDEDPLVERIRRMPPRSQLELAAGIGGATLTAGVVVLLASRPLLDMIEAWRERRAVA